MQPMCRFFAVFCIVLGCLSGCGKKATPQRAPDQYVSPPGGSVDSSETEDPSKAPK